jgi:hypothetical protein
MIQIHFENKILNFIFIHSLVKIGVNLHSLLQNSPFLQGHNQFNTINTS